MIATPPFGKLGLPSAAVEEIGESLMAAILFRRFGTPEEAAHAAVFLAPSDASHITGTELTVDGGRAQL